MAELNFKSTTELKVPKRLIEQVLGQENAVNIIKKAAEQRRHVLLIGDPGTGKSMLGMGLAELLPKEKLVDIISFPNPNDENTPFIRTVPAGSGRDLVNKARLQGMQLAKGQSIFLFIILIISTVFPFFLWQSKKISDVIYAASLIGSFLIVGIFMISINLNRKSIELKVRMPKVIVDNYRKKQAPFFDATGAHAGALLGDVLHDPFQCFINSDVYIKEDTSQSFRLQSMEKIWDNYFTKHKNNIMRNREGYEAIFLRRNELFVLGELNGSITPVEALSCNRQDYDGSAIKITTSENKEIIVTPEHKIAVNRNGKIDYVSAKNIKEGDEITSRRDDVIIDEQEIISNYN